MNTDPNAEAADPATPPERLAEIAYLHPHLAATVAAHPAAYPALLEWIAEHRNESTGGAGGGDGEPATGHVTAWPRFPSAGFAEWRAALSGRRRVFVLLVVAGMLVIELVISGVLLALQKPESEYAGYRFGSQVGATAAVSASFDSPYIEDHILALSPDGSTVYALAVNPDRVLAFDAETLAAVASAGLSDSPRSITAATDGRIFVLVGDGTVEIFEADLDDSRTLTLATESFLSQIEIAPDGSRIYAIPADVDTVVAAFDADSGASIGQSSVDDSRVNGIGVATGTGDVFAVTDYVIAAFDASLSPIAQIPLASDYGSEYYHLPVSADGRRVFPGSACTTYRLEGMQLLDTGECYFGGSTNELSADGSFAVDERLAVFDFASGETVFDLPVGYVWARPLILPDPADGFVVFQVDGSPGDAFPGQLQRWETDAPRVTVASLLRVFGWIDLGLLVLTAIAVLLLPWWRAWRAAAPQRRAASEAQAAAAQQAEAERIEARYAAQRQAEHEARVAQLAQWQAAYQQLNPGQPVPAMPPTAFAAAPANTGTNTMAILALVFGLGGGLLGIIFGHAARSQIRRTGEGGWGLATAGLVFGYLGLVVGVIVVIVVVALSASGR